MFFRVELGLGMFRASFDIERVILGGMEEARRPQSMPGSLGVAHSDRYHCYYPLDIAPRAHFLNKSA